MVSTMFESAKNGYPQPTPDYYKVYVKSITYNQSQYIEDCLKGVAMQYTHFPIVHHIIDDCSTDGEQQTILSYIERECDSKSIQYYDNEVCQIVISVYKNNPNCTLVAYLLKKNLFHNEPEKQKLCTPWRKVCKYEALCEGDDYWTDYAKLEKQVDFLESHDDYTLIGGNANICTADGKFLKTFSNMTSDDISMDSIIKSWTIPTASILYRTKINDRIPYIKNAPQGDIIIQMACADIGRCRYDSAVCCVYRWLVPGSSTARVRNNQLDYYQRHYDMWVKLNEYFEFKYDKAIQERLKETKRKIIRERFYLKVPVLRKLREMYRTFRGY